MAALRKLDTAQTRHGARDAVDLFDGAVLILEALNRQYGAGDVPEKRFDAPGCEIRVEPDVVPAPERAFDIGVLARQFFAQIAFEQRKPG